MKSRIASFEGELSTQQSLSGHLATRALDAFEAGDSESFINASEIHDETQSRIMGVRLAKGSFEDAIENYKNGGSIKRVLGAGVLGMAVLNRELVIA